MDLFIALMAIVGCVIGAVVGYKSLGDDIVWEEEPAVVRNRIFKNYRYEDLYK
jgi:membrane protein YqaA with SNARE-associated domain